MNCVKYNFHKKTKSKCSLLIDHTYLLYSKRFDITNTLITYIGDEKIIETLGEVRINILQEINEKINVFLNKITFDLTKITREDVLELKKEVYELMSLNKEAKLISLK